jgi:hypothetical protein
MAGKKLQDTDEFLRQLLVEELDYDDGLVVSPSDLNQMVLDWDWPENQPKIGTGKLEDVTGVIREMADGCDFSEATYKRAEEPKQEDHSREVGYRSTVRSDCTSAHRGVAHGAEEFRNEVDEMLKSHNNPS